MTRNIGFLVFFAKKELRLVCSDAGFPVHRCTRVIVTPAPAGGPGLGASLMTPSHGLGLEIGDPASPCDVWWCYARLEPETEPQMIICHPGPAGPQAQ